MKAKRKKYLTAIIVTVLIVLYYSIAAILFYIYNELPITVKVMVFVVPSIMIIIMMAMVLFERFREIKEGEEDDLSKY